MPEEPMATFGTLLKRHRLAAGMTHEELAAAAPFSVRGISDLERGITRRPHPETVRRLANALNLSEPDREEFKAASIRERDLGHAATPPATRARRGTDPQAWLSYIVTTLDGSGVAAARSAVTQWQLQGTADSTWLTWADDCIMLTAEGRLAPAGRRPLPARATGPFLGRERQTVDLGGFLDRVQQGRGGVALIAGPGGIGKSRLIIEALAEQAGEIRVEWMTCDRGEAGYQGWRRLLTPLWSNLRRTEVAPTHLLVHAATLDDILLVSAATEPAQQRFPGEVAAAIAALLMHVAALGPLVLVIDNAHHGGADSDYLLLDIARRANASRVGLVAAMRPGELDADSPLHPYLEQADGHTALDVVTSIIVPPLDLPATAGLLRYRTGVEPPAAIVERVLRQTDGQPQRINNIPIQAPPDGAAGASWAVGALESAIEARPAATRHVLRAAAVCAEGGWIEPDLIAEVTALPANSVVQILDHEIEQGTLLTRERPGYRFQHENWIDALEYSCTLEERGSLHARCLTLLRPDPTVDPRRLVRHAVGAGASGVEPAELVALARAAADRNVADYAFGAAAEMYGIAARHAAGAEKIDLLVAQSDALRFRGLWKEARQALKQAASLAKALEQPGNEAVALIHLERLTWSYGLDESEVTQQIRDVIDRLPDSAMELRSQAQGALALRLSITKRKYQDEQADLARALLQQLPSITDRLARADVLIGIRGGLQDNSSPEELLEYDRKLIDLGIELRSAHHLAEALVARVIDLIRAGRTLELASAVRAQRDFAEQSNAPYTVYSRAIINAMLALARGEFDAVQSYTAETAELSRAWDAPMASEALMAQTGWLLYETGQVNGLTGLLASLLEQDMSSLNEPVWALGTGLIHAETGDAGSAVRFLRDVSRSTSDFRDLPHGPTRIAILATATMVIGHPAVYGFLPREEATRLGRCLAELLAAHPDQMVLAGWPAVILGSKQRYIGLACLASGRPARAARHLRLAVEEDGDFAVLQTRARFDLARALLLQPARRPEGLAEMTRVKQKAAELKMLALEAQATTAQQ